MALTVVPLGFTAWAAFLYIGLRARRRLWAAFAPVYLAPLVVGLTDVLPSAVAGGIIIAGWAAAFVHALALRKPYLARMNALEDPKLEAAEDRLRRREVAEELVRADPEHALELGVGRPDVPSAYDGGLVDVNNASASALAGLPGFDEALAQRAVEVREEVGGFSSVADLGHVLDLPAATVERLRDLVVFLPR